MKPIKPFKEYVFLIGAARSGTKILRDTLASSTEISAIPYDINYIWRHGNENLDHDELEVSMISHAQKEYIRNKIIQYARKANHSGSVLVEKTVANPLRIEFVKAIFPEAKFIHLVRNGFDVTESSVRQWTTAPPSSYFIKKLKYFPITNLRYMTWFTLNFISGIFSKQSGGKTWGPRYKGIYQELKKKSLEEICATQWKECIEKALRSFENIPDNEHLYASYENFVSSGDSLKSICQFIGISHEMPIHYYEKHVVSSNIGKSTNAGNLSTKVKEIINKVNV